MLKFMIDNLVVNVFIMFEYLRLLFVVISKCNYLIMYLKLSRPVCGYSKANSTQADG